jgi:SNF2 family DNA or RNA helicase
LLSGTPAPNSKLEYWSQVRMLDKTLLGASFYAFRNKYYQSCGYEGYTWIEKLGMGVELMEKIASVSTVVRKEDVLDLPERTFQERHIQLSPIEAKAYNDMAKEMLVEIEDQEITAFNAAVKIMKLRQVTAGFLFDEDGEIHSFGSSKLNSLMELLEEIGDHQVLIWTQFQYEAERIEAYLGETSGICNGTIRQDVKEFYVKAFKNGDIQYLIAHPRTLGHGVTLTNCNYAIYYSLSYSHEEHYQSRDRIYRKGQENHCTYYYLIVPKTIDSVIYKALQKKENIAEGALNYIKNLGRLK